MSEGSDGECSGASLTFHFQLTPVEEIAPCGLERGELSLSWFALTMGWFWIEVGGEELFRYSDSVLEYWTTVAPDMPERLLLYEDYQVARYWQDLMDILPAVLDPLPLDLAELVADATGWEELLAAMCDWRQRQNGDEPMVLQEMAASWWGNREYYAGHLAYPPKIWMWRIEDFVFVRWDNREVMAGGIPVWTARQGEVVLRVADFLAAAESFDIGFRKAMGERVQAIRAGRERTQVAVDLEGLARGQDAGLDLRERAVDPWVAEVRRGYSWEQVREAVAEIRKAIEGNRRRSFGGESVV